MNTTRFLSLVIVVLCIVWHSHTDARAPGDCGEPEEGIPFFQQLAVFPNPVQVGQALHVRAVVNLPRSLQGSITNGTILMELKLNDNVIASISNIPLCGSTTSIACSTLRAGDNALSFDFNVPTIPEGKYSVRIRAHPLSSGITGPACIGFDVQVEDPKDNDGKFVSWLSAELVSVAQFENPDYTQRVVGDIVQIGPIGPAPSILAYTYQWGTFMNIQGSEDLVKPMFDTSGLVWGLDGIMTELIYSPKKRSQTYTGEFYVGYITSHNLAQRTLDQVIINGNFSLTWAYVMGENGLLSTSLRGSIDFNDDAVLPAGWGAPILVGGLGAMNVFTADDGALMVSGTRNHCLTKTPCNFEEEAQKDDGGLSDADVGILIGVLVGIPVLVALITAIYFWHRHKRTYEEEDGIFSAARKPEYGNALVVDDIIQETREHSPELMPRLDRRGDDYSDEDDYRRGRRGRRASRNSVSRSRTPSRSDSVDRSDRSRSRSVTRSYTDDYSSDDGSSRSRA